MRDDQGAIKGGSSGVSSVVLLAMIWSSLVGCSAQPAPAYFEKVADAIYKAEGGSKTRYPYGIKSVKVSSPEEARRVCLRTLQHSWRDWEGRGDFIVFLCQRYCPPSAHPLNRNWIRNVHSCLKD